MGLPLELPPEPLLDPEPQRKRCNGSSGTGFHRPTCTPNSMPTYVEMEDCLPLFQALGCTPTKASNVSTLARRPIRMVELPGVLVTNGGMELITPDSLAKAPPTYTCRNIKCNTVLRSLAVHKNRQGNSTGGPSRHCREKNTLNTASEPSSTVGRSATTVGYHAIGVGSPPTNIGRRQS